MQTNCPNCSNRLVVDDAKVPPTPFMLKCPKCQGMVKVPGRGAQPTAPPLAPAAPPTSLPSEAPPAPNLAPPSFSPAPPASLSSPDRVAPPSGGATKALVSFPSADMALTMASVLGRLGFAVDQLDAVDDKILRLQQGEYAVVASGRNGVAEDRNVYRMMQTMPLEIRRRLFLVLVGDDVQTGEGTQAFALLADLVVQSKDAAACDRLLAQTLHERKRIYQTFWDAEDRKLEGKL